MWATLGNNPKMALFNVSCDNPFIFHTSILLFTFVDLLRLHILFKSRALRIGLLFLVGCLTWHRHLDNSSIHVYMCTVSVYSFIVDLFIVSTCTTSHRDEIQRRPNCGVSSLTNRVTCNFSKRILRSKFNYRISINLIFSRYFTWTEISILSYCESRIVLSLCCNPLDIGQVMRQWCGKLLRVFGLSWQS